MSRSLMGADEKHCSTVTTFFKHMHIFLHSAGIYSSAQSRQT